MFIQFFSSPVLSLGQKNCLVLLLQYTRFHSFGIAFPFPLHFVDYDSVLSVFVITHTPLRMASDSHMSLARLLFRSLFAVFPFTSPVHTSCSICFTSLFHLFHFISIWLTPHAQLLFALILSRSAFAFPCSFLCAVYSAQWKAFGVAVHACLSVLCPLHCNVALFLPQLFV